MTVESPDKSSKTQLRANELLLGENATKVQQLIGFIGHGILLTITSLSALAVLFIFIFIIRDALPFFSTAPNPMEFFKSTEWHTDQEPPMFGALAIFVGSALVTIGSVIVAVPLGVAAALCLSDVLPFAVRQVVKPVIELLAAIPSVAYGFFALVVFAPLLQTHGGPMLAWTMVIITAPLALITSVVIGDLLTTFMGEQARAGGRFVITAVSLLLMGTGIYFLGQYIHDIEILSGRNALNVSIILGIMALPTVVSVSEDALSAVGRDMREGSYALGATRAETLLKVVIPAASSGILAAILLGIMRAFGETMVVWMAAGNASRIPEPFYNYLSPVRTLTATIAGDMAETARQTAHYHCLFLMGFALLTFSFISNLISEWAIRRQRKKLG